MCLRHANAKFLRQPRVRPALITPSDELERYKEILGFELH
jgi:hypothetical protein